VLKPGDVLAPALLARVDALAARLAYVPQAMTDEATRVAAIRAQLGQGVRVNQADADLVLRTAGTDFERQYWASLIAAAT